MDEITSSGNVEVQGEVSTPDQSANTAPGPNPAWNDVLSLIPETLHEQITPHFQKWDQSAQSRIEGVKGQYADYEPFLEHGITPDQLQQGLQLMHEMVNNPRTIYDALVDSYGYGNEQPNNEEVEELSPQDNELQQLRQGFDLLAQAHLDQQNAKEAAEADAALEQSIKDAKTKHGDFDEDYVLTHMMNGKSIDEAIQTYQALTERIIQSNPRPFAPSIMSANSGSGVGLPSQATDVTKLDGNETRSLVAEMLRQAQQR